MNIRKINPNPGPLKPITSGAGMGTGLKAKKNDYATHTANNNQTIPVSGSERGVLSPDQYMSGGQSRMSGASLGSVLPDLQKINLNRVKGAQSNNSQTIDASSNAKLRKASPEALALMMANIKKNDGMASSNSS